MGERRPGWLIVSRIASLSNNDGLLPELPPAVCWPNIAPSSANFVPKKYCETQAATCQAKQDQLKTLLTFQFFRLNTGLEIRKNVVKFMQIITGAD